MAAAEQRLVWSLTLPSLEEEEEDEKDEDEKEEEEEEEEEEDDDDDKEKRRSLVVVLVLRGALSPTAIEFREAEVNGRVVFVEFYQA